MFACSYSSETGKWSDLVSTAVPFLVYSVCDPGTLVGNALYWMPLGLGYGILESDLVRHNLAVIEWPPGANGSGNGRSHILLTEDGGLGLAILSCGSLQMWERIVYSEHVTKWVLRKTVDKTLGLGPWAKIGHAVIVGYAEDINVMLLWMGSCVYMLQLDSLESKKLWETNIVFELHPYTGVYVPEKCDVGINSVYRMVILKS